MAVAIAAGLVAVAVHHHWQPVEAPMPTPIESVEAVTTVPYCELLKNPRVYDGRIIRLSAELPNGAAHGFFLLDTACAEMRDENYTAILFAPADREVLWNRLADFFRKGRPFEPVQVVVVGRFKYREGPGSSDLMADRTHLQLELHTIESASR